MFRFYDINIYPISNLHDKGWVNFYTTSVERQVRNRFYSVHLLLPTLIFMLAPPIQIILVDLCHMQHSGWVFPFQSWSVSALKSYQDFHDTSLTGPQCRLNYHPWHALGLILQTCPSSAFSAMLMVKRFSYDFVLLFRPLLFLWRMYASNICFQIAFLFFHVLRWAFASLYSFACDQHVLFFI